MAKATRAAIERLIEAAEQGRVRTIQQLLAEGVPVDGRRGDGTTAMIAAASQGKVAVVRMLLDAGAKVDARHRTFGTALNHAVVGATSMFPKEGADEVIEVLIAAGADVNLSDREGMTPLMHCFSIGGEDTRILDLLLKAGADVHVRAKDRSDGLYWAVVHHGLAGVKRLLKAGADVNRIYEEGETLLDWLDPDGEGKARGAGAIYRVIRKAGGRYAKELKAGRAARREHRKAMEQEARRERRSEQADRRVVPDFRQAAKAEAYQEAARELERICGTERLVTKQIPGLCCCQVSGEKGKRLLKSNREAFLARGCFLFRAESLAFMEESPELLCILPTTDQLEVVARMAAGCGGNQGIGIAKVLRGLRKIGSLTPFVLERVAHDTLEGQFLQKHSDTGEVARLMYRICPDIVEQGTETVEALAKELRRTSRLFLWWD